MEPTDIDTDSLPAVKNLKSKFEQLSALSPRQSGPGLVPATPRPRATSGSHPNGDRVPDSPILRASNSSSDLRSGRKPPPPPPVRSAKPSPAPSPTNSPLLRPVANTSASLGPRSGLSTAVVLPEVNVEEAEPIPSVSSLRSLFANAPTPSSPEIRSLHTPRPSITGLPSAHSEPDVTGIKRPPPPPPISQVLRDSPEDFSPPDLNGLLSLHSESDLTVRRIFTLQNLCLSPTAIRSRPYHLPSCLSRPLCPHDIPTISAAARARLPVKVILLLHVFRHLDLLRDINLPRSSNPHFQLHYHPHYPSAETVPYPQKSLLQHLPGSPFVLPYLFPTPIPTFQYLHASPFALPYPFPSPIPTHPPRLRRTLRSAKCSVQADYRPLLPARSHSERNCPPARRPPSPSSDEESGDEAPTPDLPDSSRSSRRPPHLSFRAGYVGPSEPKITVPAHHGHVIVSGTRIVVATHHHVKIYDVSQSDAPVFSLDKKDIGHGHGIKGELRVTSMEYRPCGDPADRGCLLWIGTKDGHLVELDVRTGCVTAAKPAAHIHPIVRIFRYGRSMITLDDGGKTLLFAPAANDGEDIQLAFTPPRVARITEKQDFAQMVGGKLWTATRAELHGARMQTIRVFDLFVPGAPGRAVVPIEPVGAITDATMLPSNPGIVYLGHEAGSVSLWTLKDDGWPRCIEVVRVSTSDVLCVEGPWVVTNAWMAHPKLPVNQLAVDHYGIEKTGRLCVVSVGRDEQVKLWDGLLGSDWVDLELMKREASFSTFRDLSVLIVSWNADSARPDSLSGDLVNMNFLQEALTSVDCPDIITFGFQEVVDLESRKMVAKNVLLGRKDKQDVSAAQITGLSGLSEKVTTAYRKWYEFLLHAVRLAMPAQVPYTVIHTESLVGLFTCVFVKNTERMSVKDNVITSMKRGMGGRYGNKGGIITRLVIEDSSICFINCHLAAGQHATRARNADIAAMLEERSLLPESENEPLAYVGGGDGQMALDHEIVFLNGDMNYRIDQRRDHIIAAVRANEFESLLAHDQLLKEIKYNRGCRLRGLYGGPAHLSPRRARAGVQLHYRRYEANVSDHRPVSAAFKFTVKSIRHDVRQKAKAEIQIQWTAEQERLLSVSRDFYVDLALAVEMDISGELQILKDAIKEYGTVNSDGRSSCAYGILFDKTANTLEALNGTLRAAKRQKKVAFDAEILMMPKDKDVQVVLLE
ncbi:IPPc domain-containing protein [Mycena venus]|uniref:IPPc domain-containing protein n=1 Tax=Mycena venus TaxID=2733690 RepID=A0A8H7CBS7_9AGAR|nr:IPPc domain-containing protein [Mycena venus]